MPKQYFNVSLGALPALVEAQNYLRRKLPAGTDYNDPASFHVTLLSIEDTNGVNMAEMSPITDLPMFGVPTSSYIDWWETSDGRVAVFIRLRRTPELMYLQSSLFYRAQAMGVKISAYSYPHAWVPHITLAYMRERPEDFDFMDYSPDNAAFEVRGFVLQDADEAEPVADWQLVTQISVQEQGRRGAPKLTEQMSTINGRSQVNLTCVSEMAGQFPKIELPEDVDTAALKKRYPNRAFVTLPVGRFDAESRNGRRYLESAMRRMAEQINAKRPEGGWGHIKDEDFGSSYPPPAIRALRAEIIGDTVWAKFWPLTEEANEYYQQARDTNARVGTSLYAWAEVDEDGNVADLDLIRLDMADPARVGVPMTAAFPALSGEMAQQQSTTEEKNEAAADEPPEEPEMTDNVTELTVRVEKQKARIEELERIEKAHQSLAVDVREVREMLGLKETDDMVRSVRAVLEQHAEMKAENSKLLAGEMSNRIAGKVAVESLRPMVQALVEMEHPTTAKELERAMDKVLAREEVKTALAAAVVAESGPPVRTPVENPRQTAGTGQVEGWQQFLGARPDAKPN